MYFTMLGNTKRIIIIPKGVRVVKDVENWNEL